MIKAALFDLDGTLVETLEDLADSVNFALNKYGLPTHELHKFNYFVGNGMVNLIERSLPENVTDKETFDKVFEAFYNHYSIHYLDKTYVYEGLKEALTELKNKGLKLAVVSNKRHEMTEAVIEKTLNGYFDIVTGQRPDYPVKPDPTLALKIIGELGVEPSECVFIGDSGMDAKTSVNIGCAGIGVLWGFRTEDELLENGAKYIAKEPKDIVEIIEGINNGI